MKILITILLALVGIVALLLVIALFMKKEYTINREIIINAAQQKVFDYIKLLKNQDKFNKWVMVDPSMKRDFRGTDGTVGFVYAWDGNKQAGAGEQEIKSLNEGNKIETEIRFVRPMKSIAYANMTLSSLSENQTKLIWTNGGKMPYPMNIIVSMVENMLAKDMDISLTNLKNILEH
ncbi:MAG: SRPBCC family protein [bacterium]|nr:SRPBCC family protein [bacterium]